MDSQVVCPFPIGLAAGRAANAKGAYRKLSRAIALLLLVASALKGFALVSETPFAAIGQRSSDVLLVELEVAFALWLLMGPYPRLTWTMSVLLFGLFSGVSLSKAMAGEMTCGCLGNVPVPPWVTEK